MVVKFLLSKYNITSECQRCRKREVQLKDILHSPMADLSAETVSHNSVSSVSYMPCFRHFYRPISPYPPRTRLNDHMADCSNFDNIECRNHSASQKPRNGPIFFFIPSITKVSKTGCPSQNTLVFLA